MRRAAALGCERPMVLGAQASIAASRHETEMLASGSIDSVVGCPASGQDQGCVERKNRLPLALKQVLQ